MRITLVCTLLMQQGGLLSLRHLSLLSKDERLAMLSGLQARKDPWGANCHSDRPRSKWYRSSSKILSQGSEAPCMDNTGRKWSNSRAVDQISEEPEHVMESKAGRISKSERHCRPKVYPCITVQLVLRWSFAGSSGQWLDPGGCKLSQSGAGVLLQHKWSLVTCYKHGFETNIPAILHCITCAWISECVSQCDIGSGG